MWPFINNFIELFTESAPWLLLGLVIAGIMNRLVPIDILQKHMGNNDFKSIFKAAVIGAPLPLCSCGVIPAALGLRRAGASRSATVSFLVATPETGVDSISVSYALLGPFMAVIRPVAAVFSAIATGVLVMFTSNDEKSKLDANTDTSCCSTDDSLQQTLQPNKAEESSCCGSEKTVEEPSCCSSQKQPVVEQSKPGILSLISSSLMYSSGKLLSDITKWLMIGLLLAAVIKTWVPTDFLMQWGDGFLAMLVMALVGIPMYICATASTPIAAGFLAAGVSPGAILVFMLAGPATNIATMGMIKQELGQSVLAIYVASIVSISILFGYLTNFLITKFSFVIHKVAANGHNIDESLVYQISAAVLAILMLRNTLLSFRKSNHAELSTSH